MSKSGQKSQAQLDASSRSKNAQDPVGRAAMANAAAQRTVGTPAFQAVQENRQEQLANPPATPRPSKQAEAPVASDHA